jgi:ADP-heptose:LPS heptosyltransferase
VTRTLAVRLDSLGDVLVTGPAVRALAASSSSLTVLAGPLGRPAAELLPGVDEVLCWRAPWIDARPEPVDREHVEQLRGDLEARRFDRAVVFTSFHQSALPTALVLRLAGVPWVGAISEDYPGSLLDVRHRVPDDLPEPVRALSLATACGAALPPGDDGRLAVRAIAPVADHPAAPYVVLHPGTSVAARAWPPERFREACALLVDQGHRVVVTGAPSERALTAYVAGTTGAEDLGGRTDVAGLAAVLAGADVVVVGNTGPAHLAAAVGTPVVSLFAPTVPAVRWAPYGVPRIVLGDQHAPCRDSRATTCPVPGHPCLSSVSADDVLTAVRSLCGSPVGGPVR